MNLRKKFKEFKNWCPQPHTPLPTKLKQYSIPIVILLTVTLFAASLSIFYSTSVLPASVPQIPSIPVANLPVSSTSVSSAAPAVEWQKNLPSELGISATCIIQTSDGGYAVGGDCDYKTGVPPGYLVKLNSSGNIEWNQSYAKYTTNKFTDNIQALLQTKDEGYALLIGGSELIKTNSEGKVLWNITFNLANVASSMVQTNDGGYVVTGYATINQVLNGRYESNFWLAKFNSAGAQLWNKTFGNPANTEAFSVIQTSEGGYALTGKISSSNINQEFYFWLVKTDSIGDEQWNKTFGSPGYDNEANSVIQTSDGGYVLAGFTNAYRSGDYDAQLVKTDSSGNLSWTQTYAGTGQLTYTNLPTVFGSNGSNGNNYAYSVIQTSDGGLAFIGTSEYEPGTSSTVAWLVKTDSTGNTQWNETFGSPFQSWAGNSLIETSDGGFAIAGYNQSPGTPAGGNYYVVKTEAALPPPSPTSTQGPSPSSTPIPSQFNLVLLASLTLVVIVIVIVAVVVLRRQKSKYISLK
jgi:hypothetical protein